MKDQLEVLPLQNTAELASSLDIYACHPHISDHDRVMCAQILFRKFEDRSTLGHHRHWESRKCLKRDGHEDLDVSGERIRSGTIATISSVVPNGGCKRMWGYFTYEASRH